MPRTDYIGEDWYGESGAPKKPNSSTGKPPAPTPTTPPLQMDGDASGGAGVRSRGAAEQAGLDRAVAAAQQMHAAPPPGGYQVYGGVGGYQYEVRGNDIYITGSKGVKLPEPRRVDPATPRGAVAYNAIVAELNASEGLGLKPVKVPVSPATKPETPGYKGRDTADLDAAQATAAMPGANAAQAAEIRRGIDEDLSAQRAKKARAREEGGAFASIYADEDVEREDFYDKLKRNAQREAIAANTANSAARAAIYTLNPIVGATSDVLATRALDPYTRDYLLPAAQYAPGAGPQGRPK